MDTARFITPPYSQALDSSPSDEGAAPALSSSWIQSTGWGTEFPQPPTFASPLAPAHSLPWRDSRVGKPEVGVGR